MGAGESASKTLETGASRINSVLDSLKRFVSLDEAERKKIDVQAGLDSAITVLGAELDGVQINRTYSDADAMVECFPARLNQAFLHLVRNAAQAVQQGGEIHLTVRLDGDEVDVTVEDNGPGIAPEVLESVFDFGFSKEGDRVRMRLGLPTSKRIVEEIGGQLDIWSEPQRGTKVRIRLPAT